MEFVKKYKEQSNNSKLDYLAQKFDFNIEIIKLLVARGLDTEEKINTFINAGVTQLNNPFLLKNMDKVVEKIKYYIDSDKQILIMGDYDTDGISASAILYKYFESIHKKVNVFLPNRFVDGYGLTCESLDKVKSLYSPDLIITVDCGITCVEEIDYCKKLGIDIIVTDHHDIPQTLPDTLIINPKLDGQLYPFKELCGAGVALKLVHALGGLEESLKYTTIASLATVADIVPLTDENRAIVKLGLAGQKEQLPKGLKKLCSRLKMSLPLTSSDISFKLAPKINATGRMGDASISFNLYVEKEDVEIEKNIDLLLELNDKRVNETNVIFESACEMLKDTNVSRLGMIVLFNENWESGVLGIICSKLVEKYNKPVCLLSRVDDEYKGSCRSIPAVNIFDALTSVQDLLIRFGGHNQAGGLSIEGKNLKEFRKRINEYVLNNTKEEDLVTKKYYDLDLTNANVDAKFVKDLDIFEPTGFKNEKPTFRFQIDNNSAIRMTNFPQHLRLKYKDLNFIAFNKGEYFYNLNVNCLKEIIVELFIEKYSKKEKISGFVRNINYSRLSTATKSEIVGANYLTQLKAINNKSEYCNYRTLKFDEAIKRINDICKKSKFGTAILINDMDTYFASIKLLPDIHNYELFDIKNACGENVIVFSPDIKTNLKDYDNIFMLDSFLCEGYVASISTKFNKIYTVQDRLNMSLFANLDTSRETFARIHNAIRVASINTAVPDLVSYFNQLRKLNLVDKSIKYNEFIFFVMVMEELGIMKYSDGLLSINNGVKSNLNDSAIYNFVSQFVKIK